MDRVLPMPVTGDGQFARPSAVPHSVPHPTRRSVDDAFQQDRHPVDAEDDGRSARRAAGAPPTTRVRLRRRAPSPGDASARVRRPRRSAGCEEQSESSRPDAGPERVLQISQVHHHVVAGGAGRGKVTDEARARIEPFLLPMVQRGGRWREHRQVVDAVSWALRTGAPSRDLPERHGPWKTAHERLRKWIADGTWERMLAEVVVEDDSTSSLHEATAVVVSIDSTRVRTHQDSSGTRLTCWTYVANADERWDLAT